MVPTPAPNNVDPINANQNKTHIDTTLGNNKINLRRKCSRFFWHGPLHITTRKLQKYQDPHHPIPCQPTRCKHQQVHTHIFEINIPQLHIEDRIEYIVPNLQQHSLFFVQMLYAAGFQAVFTDNKCTVWHKNNIVQKIANNITTNLWMLSTTTRRYKKAIGTPPSNKVH